MHPEPLTTPQAWPGVQLAFGPGARLGGLSAAAQALQAQSSGRWADFTILDDPSRRALTQALDEPRGFELDLRLAGMPEAGPQWLRCVGRWDPADRTHHCQLADITDLMLAWRPTSERLDLLQEMVDSLPMLIVQIDTGPELPCVFAAGRLLDLVAASDAGLEGQGAMDAFRPELHPSLQALLAPDADPTPRAFAWHLSDAQGAMRVLEGNVYTQTGADGQPASHLINAMETTAYHATMAELQTTEDRLRRFVTASRDGILLSADHQIIDANPAACQLLAAPVDALRLQRLIDIVAPEDRAAFESHIGRASTEALQCHLIDQRGARMAVELIGRNEQRWGRNIQMVIVRDVRDRRETQARIDALIADLRTQKDRAEAADRAKSLFLSAASHDLRQPIHAFGLLLTSLEALLHIASPARATVDEVTHRMGHSLDTLSRLLNSLLDVSRLDAGAVAVHPRPMPLATLLEDIEGNLLESARLKGLRLDVVTTDLWVHTDAFALGRILENLVANAIRYTPRGRVLVVARPRGTQVEVQVWDTGIGIAPDQIGHIFGEFYRVRAGGDAGTDPPGLGLGLSIVQRSARLLGAPLQVRSTPGRGSMFSVRVPRTEPQTAAPVADEAGLASGIGEEPVPVSQVPRRILVIDDDAMVVEAMQQLLEAWGHEVWCASDADQAIMQAVTHADDIDLVLSDYHLANEVDTSQFIDALRACIAQPVPVYVFTADTSARVAREVQGRGLGLMHKPVREDALRQILQQRQP